jgi:hypothetical protein
VRVKKLRNELPLEGIILEVAPTKPVGFRTTSETG